MGRSGQFPRDFCPRRHSCPAALCPHKATTRTFACHSSIPWADHHSAKGPSASSPRRCSFVVAWASARVAFIVQDTRSPPWEGEAPAEPKCSLCCRAARLSRSFALPNGEAPAGPNIIRLPVTELVLGGPRGQRGGSGRAAQRNNPEEHFAVCRVTVLNGRRESSGCMSASPGALK